MLARQAHYQLITSPVEEPSIQMTVKISSSYETLSSFLASISLVNSINEFGQHGLPIKIGDNARDHRENRCGSLSI